MSLPSAIRMLRSGALLGSSMLRWQPTRSHNPIFAFVTRLTGGKNVVFPIPPRYDQKRVQGLQGDDRGGGVQAGHRSAISFDQIIEAYRYVETGRKIGNVVITVDPAS